MISRRVFLASSLGAVTLTRTPARAAEPSVQIGMVQGMFRDVQPAMVQAISKPLRNIIASQTGLQGDVEIVPDAHTLADKMASGRFSLGVFHGFEFAWVRGTDPDLIPIVVTVPPARLLKAVVVVNADSTVKSLADLEDESVLVPRGTKAHCYLYLETEKINLPATTATLKTKPALTSEEALDAVILGDAVAAVVDVSALLGYQRLQPGASRNLRVLCESAPFPPTVIATRKGALPEATIDNIRRLLTTAHQNPAGKPLLMLWNLKGFETVPANYSDQLAAVCKRYPAPAPNAFPGATARTLGRTAADR